MATLCSCAIIKLGSLCMTEEAADEKQRSHSPRRRPEWDEHDAHGHTETCYQAHQASEHSHDVSDHNPPVIRRERGYFEVVDCK